MFNDPYTRALQGGYKRSGVITTHNTNALPEVPNEIYVGTAGNITCRLEGDTSDRVFKSCPAGITLYVRATHIRTTGTTAADMVALYE